MTKHMICDPTHASEVTGHDDSAISHTSVNMVHKGRSLGLSYYCLPLAHVTEGSHKKRLPMLFTIEINGRAHLESPISRTQLSVFL